MKIRITRTSITYIHTILLEKDKVFSDGIETEYNPDRFAFKVCNLVSDWPDKLEEQNVTDGLKYEIKIKKGKEIKKYEFINKFPDDIDKLEEIINGVIEAEINV